MKKIKKLSLQKQPFSSLDLFNKKLTKLMNLRFLGMILKQFKTLLNSK